MLSIRDSAAMQRALSGPFDPDLQTILLNQHDVVDVLISALIDHDVNTRARIIGAAIRLDRDRGHVAIRLKGGLGHRWTRDEDGIYHNVV